LSKLIPNIYLALDFYKKALSIYKKTLTLKAQQTKRTINNYKIVLHAAQSSLAPATYEAHTAFIQSEFLEYLD
jgi:hypothetical protein